MMSTYYAEMSYSRRKNKNISIRLKIDETINVGENKSNILVSVEYKNTGDRIMISDYGAEISATVNNLNGFAVGGSTKYLENTGGEWLDYPGYAQRAYNGLAHTSSGGGSFTVTAEFTAENILGIPATKGSINFTHDYEAINQTAPTISSHAVKSNRYGRETTFYLNTSHASYNLKCQLTIDGLTREQATAHSGFSWYIDSVHVASRSTSSNGSYSIIYDFEFNNKTVSGNWLINLISGTISDSKYYNSGQSYHYKLTVSAENNKGITVSGVMAVPQKVTGITADSSLDIIQGQTEQISYFVAPSNAELQSVSFISSDIGTATVDENGTVTAVSDGICTVTVTTEDGGFSAETVINVVDTSRFPALNYFTDYLSIVDVSRIIFACTFLSDELTEHGATVDKLITISIQGRAQPINSIRGIFSAVESNCQKLRDAAVSAGLTIDSLPEARAINKANTDWIIVVNGWIDLLNEIHTKINGGD